MDRLVLCMQSVQRNQILKLVELLEAASPVAAPTEHLDLCKGSWRLLFSTVTVLVRRIFVYDDSFLLRRAVNLKLYFLTCRAGEGSNQASKILSI
jgi:hypothetical protein